MTETCSICTEPLYDKDITVLSCGHRIHSRCMMQWAQECTKKRKAITCVYCRNSLLEYSSASSLGRTTDNNLDSTCCKIIRCSLVQCTIGLSPSRLLNIYCGGMYCNCVTLPSHEIDFCQICGVWECAPRPSFGCCCLPLQITCSDKWCCFLGIPCHEKCVKCCDNCCDICEKCLTKDFIRSARPQRQNMN